MPRQMRGEFAEAIYHVMNEEMNRLGWSAEALRQAGKGNEEKVRLAARLRRETTMSLKWTAQQVERGSWSHVSNLLVARRKHESLKSEN